MTRSRTWLSHRLARLVVWLNPSYDFRAVGMVTLNARHRMIVNDGTILANRPDTCAAIWMVEDDYDRLAAAWWKERRP